MSLKDRFVRGTAVGKAVCFMILGVLLSTTASAVEYWVSCSSCSEQNARIAAAAALPPAETYWGGRTEFVYVLDPINRSARKYEIITAVEPGLVERWTTEIYVESSVKASLASFWVQAEAFAKIDVPADRSPSAVDYLVNPYYSGRTAAWLDQGANGLVGMMNAALFVANVSAAQALASLGADRGPLILVLDFADGSKLKVTVTMGQNAITNAPTIVDISVVRNSAFDPDDNPLPTQADGMAGYDVHNPSPSLVEALQRLANMYGIPVTAGCGAATSGSRWNCLSNGNCTLTHPC